MNREYFFRGKDIESGKWVYGGFFPTFYGKILFIVKDFNNFRKVIPETVEQFTGLFDKNHRKIFEGDIIEAVYFHLGNEIHNKFVVNDIRMLSSFPWSSYKDFEVIGNIHDNSELLKGE